VVAAGVRERRGGADPATAAAASVAVATMHLSYGKGFWRGAMVELLRWVIRTMKVGA
jgi:hypothetical protein